MGGKEQKNGCLYDCLLPCQQSAAYRYERKRNPRCVANLRCECQELKPKPETNSSFLVIHPSSGVHTVNTEGCHLNYLQKLLLQSGYQVSISNYNINDGLKRQQRKPERPTTVTKKIVYIVLP